MNTIFNPQNVKNNIILGKVINGGEVILYNTINITVLECGNNLNFIEI